MHESDDGDDGDDDAALWFERRFLIGKVRAMRSAAEAKRDRFPLRTAPRLPLRQILKKKERHQQR